MRAFATVWKPRRITRVSAMALIAFAFVLTAVVVFPQIVGASGSYVVLSGSMSPTIHAGDVVISRHVETTAIEAGDVIVFEDGSVSPSDRTTHRVVNVIHRDDGVFFETKGDGNENPHANLVPADDVIGRVWFHVPYIGHLMMFARSRMGLLSLVIVPCLLLVVTEAYSLVSAVLGGDSEGTGEEKSEPTEPSASMPDSTEPAEKIG
jgi:signal peptidase